MIQVVSKEVQGWPKLWALGCVSPRPELCKSRFELTEQVLVEYAVEVKVSAHGTRVVRKVVAEVALEVIFHVAENVGLKVPEVKTIGGIASMHPEMYTFSKDTV